MPHLLATYPRRWSFQLRRPHSWRGETPHLLDWREFSNQDIASILGISPNSVKDHMKLIFQRLGVSTRSEAVSIALRDGLMQQQ